MKNMNSDSFAWIAFTERGEELAARLAAALGGEVSRGGKQKLSAWTEEAFATKTAIVFIGAAGIAVRAIAPYLQGKANDPAVVVVDEYGAHVIPLLSGHLGGANALARRIAALTGGEAVITTATDLNGAFAVDLWAARQGMTVRQTERIKTVSGKLLRGEGIRMECRWPIVGEAPESLTLGKGRADVLVELRDVTESEALQLIPRILTLGIGCRRGISALQMESAFRRFCRERQILPEAIRAAASIDRKRTEEGLLEFCRRHGWECFFYSAGELNAASGPFHGSAFVREKTGVDNVCERAAVTESGGRLLEPKFALEGVTFAVAECETNFDWSF